MTSLPNGTSISCQNLKYWYSGYVVRHYLLNKTGKNRLFELVLMVTHHINLTYSLFYGISNGWSIIKHFEHMVNNTTLYEITQVSSAYVFVYSVQWVVKMNCYYVARDYLNWKNIFLHNSIIFKIHQYKTTKNLSYVAKK